MNQLWRTLKLGLSTMALSLVFTAACGDNTPPANPDPPPPEPSACCQLADQCVVVNDPVACQNRGGEHVDNATCVDNQCQQQ